MLSVLLTSDVLACCVFLESHIQRIFIAAFSYGTSNSQLTAHKGAQLDTINPSEPQPLFTHISKCRFLLEMIPMRVHKRNYLKCWVWSTYQKLSALGTLLWVSVGTWLCQEQTLQCLGGSWSELSLNKSSSELDRTGLCSFRAIAVQKDDQSGSNCSIHRRLHLENFWVLTDKIVTAG